MGEYLQWFYRALLAGAPPSVHIVHHPTSAVDLVARRDGTEEVRLANGSAVVVDHVIVTSGHTANQDVDGSREINPYPVTPYVETIPAGAKVAVSGMGLVAVDVVTALTIGRGGEFVEDGGGLSYRPSGREPAVRLYCRSGLPFTAKSVTGVDRSTVYKPLICTPEALDALSGRSSGRRRLVDVRTELLPLLFAEMYARYYAQVAFQAVTARAPTAPRCASGCARRGLEDRFKDELARLASRFGSFDAEALFFGHQPNYHSSDDYERFVYQALADDLREAEVPDGASPVKSAAEVFRIFRDSDAIRGRARRSLARFLPGLQRGHLQPDPPPGGRPARAALPADAGADGRRSGPRAIWSRAGSRALRGRGRPWRGSNANLLNGVRAAVCGRRRRRDPWPSRGAADRRLSLAVADPAFTTVAA